MAGRVFLLLPILGAIFLAWLTLTPNSGPGTPMPQPRISKARPAEKSADLDLFNVYLYRTVPFMTAAWQKDQRDPSEILAELRALSEQRRLALRDDVIAFGSTRRESLDLLGVLTPNGHREFVIGLLSSKRWCGPAIESVAGFHDPTLIPTILERADLSQHWQLKSLATGEYQNAILAENRERPTVSTAFLIGCLGSSAMPDFSACARSDDREIRYATLVGLEATKDPNDLALVSQFNDPKLFWDRLGDRYVKVGSSAVDRLTAWLQGSACERIVATYALQRIASDKGVSAVLAAHEHDEVDYNLARNAAHSSPRAASEFALSRIEAETLNQRINAATTAGLLADQPRPAPNEEAVVASLIKASHDKEPEVRRRSNSATERFWRKASKPIAKRILDSLIAAFHDPDSQVAREAVMDAVNCPTTQSQQAIRDLLKVPTLDPYVRKTAVWGIKRVAELIKDPNS